MNKAAITLLLAGSALVATPAFAQDSGADNPFNGPRVEALVGYDNVGPGDTSDSDIEGDDQNVDGLLYGVGIGYDFAVGNAVFGIEGEYTDSTGKVDYSDPDPEGFGFGRIGVGRDLYVGARAGFLAAPSTLIYAKAGYTNARLDVLATDGQTELAADYNLDGYRLGAGVERQFGPNTFAKLEYRYSNYSNADLDVDGDPTTLQGLDIDADRHQVVLGVGYRF